MLVIEKKDRVKWILLGIFIVIIIYIMFNLAHWYAIIRYSRFKNLEFTIAKTKKIRCDKSRCDVSYVYEVEGVVYGGQSRYRENLKYPDSLYYVVYTKDDPTFQIIIPDYPVNKPFTLDSLKKEYIIKRIEDIVRTDKKDDWGEDSWNRIFITDGK